MLLARIRALYGNGVNDFLRTFIGVLLVVIPFLLLFQRPLEKSQGVNERFTWSSYAGVSAIGLFSGFLGAVTSVGSGSVIMVVLLLFVPCSPATLVGTDIVHAFALTGRGELSAR